MSNTERFFISDARFKQLIRRTERTVSLTNKIFGTKENRPEFIDLFNDAHAHRKTCGVIKARVLSVIPHEPLASVLVEVVSIEEHTQ